MPALDPATVTEDELQRVYLSGYVSGIGTYLAATGRSKQDALAIAGAVAAGFAQALDADPGLRLEALTAIYAAITDTPMIGQSRWFKRPPTS